MTILIVGLGNPGAEYAATRHNAGFMAVDHLADRLNANWKLNRRANAEITETNVNGKKIVLAKPLTFMNLSGDAVASLCGTYTVATHDVWVIYDDIDITTQQVRIRTGGGAGGHNGIKSIIARIGDNFARFRIGIGSPPTHIPLEDYVLQKFTGDEALTLEKKIEHVEHLLLEALEKGITEQTVNIATAA